MKIEQLEVDLEDEHGLHL